MLYQAFTFLLLLTVTLIGKKEPINGDSFQHHFISTSLPGNEQWGYGVSLLEDLDRDGDLDFVTAVKLDSIYWFENKSSEEWVRHTVGKINTVQLGSAVKDVDNDGWPDIIIGGDWYQNPKNPRDAPFKRFKYDGRIENEIHDIVLADIDGDGQEEIVVSGDKEGCFWYKIPPQPSQDTDWERHTITMDVVKEKDAIHSGIWPAGIDDLDNDGDLDIVLPDRWLENSNHGKEWVKHSLPFGKRGPWGLSSRSWIFDMDKDGDNDIVIADSDQTGCRIAWLENDGNDSPSFKAHYLPQEAPGTRGSFHSLALADFDGDGDVDIFTVEQEDPTIFPSGAGPRWYIWENMDGEGGKFEERVIFDEKLGGHDARVGDLDGDGDLDIVSKIWKRWPENANGGKEHISWLENLTK
ncbi:FG-GAP repeat domain-containing protein [Cyclobacterium jeungdonense]|uniref:VCBS repeat-containing protein n=1 Tax=Cyclobacterium jeungdonense TaxID=708087 RepID=A0ABT8CER9_9BACT|nr:VCBS repeat-containing protein [Cyclobacterium jeungdonense]MDN3690088.1 VCBS repeat-containing protein [Cyclobacterium jeungdonense]